MAPLIVTARLAPEVQTALNALRSRYFPPERNFLDAHLTLLHHLPSVHADALDAMLRKACVASAPNARLEALRAWATGFAVRITACGLVALHQELAGAFADVLSQQDKTPLWPHVTLQNKTPRAQSRLAFQSAQAAFVPQDTHVVAIDVWRYDGGPWHHLAAYHYGPPL